MVERYIANVDAVRQAVGQGFGIAVDFHGRVHKPMAKVLIRELEPYKLMFIEEPVLSENLSSVLDVLRNTSTPIAPGERLYSRWGLQGHPGQRGGGHHPAGPVALRWHHRGTQDRLHGRGL